ncbi:MAG: hypothetical protein E7603_00135 [Ruminococcaceae bacterium]|nr:hypothetical protein [Oscillospiraceae bacterium]
MKRKICLILAVIFTIACFSQNLVMASEIMPRYNNVLFTTTSFNITDAGEARVAVNYEGLDSNLIVATITIKIEKRNLLIFWKDVVDDTNIVYGSSYINTYVYQLEKTGTYRCTVEYVLSGAGGADDVVTFEDTKTYG